MTVLKYPLLRLAALVLAVLGPIMQVPAWAGEPPVVIVAGQAKKLPPATALQLNPPTAASATVNLPHGAAPSSPANGDCWTTTAGLHCRINGATVGPYAAATAAPTITLSGDVSGSGTTAITTAIGANKVLDTMLRPGAALSVIGRSANSTGNVADIAAASDGQVLRRSGTALGFGTVATAGIADGAVTIAKFDAAAYAEGTYTPTITALSGTITTKSATGIYVRTGNMVTVWIDITITTNGTGATAILATTPFTSRNTTQSYSGSGYQNNGTTNTALSVGLGPNAATVAIEKYDGTYPGANSTRFYVQITYPI